MFIVEEQEPLRRRSEERKDSGVLNVYLNSAPPNGVGADILARAYKHFTPSGVKENYKPLLVSSVNLKFYLIRTKS
jgi:hypothetical protein